ncbi:MAG: TolC family protein [Ectothiorhodospiraceae bacterium]|nr:TolC family protein [Ectothiorhodospiraceae bacterium]
MHPFTRARLCRLVIGGLLAVPLLAGASQPLALYEAERLALTEDPSVLRFQALAAAREDAAIAAGRLPDPMVILELMDVPADSRRLDEDGMTQARIGVRQTFPRGQTRGLSGEREQALAGAEQARAWNAERTALRAVRRAYLELYFQRAALGVLEQSQPLFEDLLEVTEREFAAGRATQQDVLRAELELERLHDRVLDTRGRQSAAEGQLARWLGDDHALRPLAAEFPTLGLPADELQAHPLLMAEQAALRAGRKEVELARQGYRPQWSVEVTYGRPTASGSGMDAPDRLSAMVMFDLPVFTRHRQDRDLAASMHRRDAAEHAWLERQRELQMQLAQAEGRWRQLMAREQRYEQRLVPQALANAEAAEQAYRARTTDFAAYVRARLTELDTRLEALRIATDRRLEQADLLYLMGEDA